MNSQVEYLKEKENAKNKTLLPGVDTQWNVCILHDKVD